MERTFDVLDVGERQLQAFIGALPEEVDARLEEAMAEIAALLEAAVEAAEPHRTGRLRAETRKFVHRTLKGIVAGVSVRGDDKADFGKAAALEYGAHRSFSVREHWARRSTVFGRDMAGKSVLIEEYQRRANIDADRYLRGPFAALEGRIVEILEKALGRAAAAPGEG